MILSEDWYKAVHILSDIEWGHHLLSSSLSDEIISVCFLFWTDTFNNIVGRWFILFIF